MRMRYIAAEPTSSYGSAYRPGYGSGGSGADLPWPVAEARETDTGSGRLDWGRHWASVSKRRWYILLLALVVTVGAVLYARSIDPVYRSTATLLIESGKTKILSIEEVYNGASADREYYQTQVEILRSHDVALRTVIATQLWDEPEFDPRRPVRSWQGKIKDFFNPPPPPLAWTPERLAEATVGRFLGGVTIEPVRLSQLVKISFDAVDPQLAAKLADAIANSFIAADRDARLKLNVSVTGLLQDRMVALREKLKQSEEELQRFREKSGVVSIAGSQGLAGLELTEIGQRLVAARVRRTELESEYQQVARIADGDFASVPAVIRQPGMAEARARASQAALQLEEVSRTLGDQHSRVQEARAAFANATKELQAQTRAAVASLRRQAEAARETERSLQAALGSARSTVQGANRQEFQLGVLEREVQTNKQLYELFLSRTKETSVSSNLQGAVARIVDPAQPATAPLRPNRAQIVLAALLLSLVGGSAAAVGVDRLGNTLQGLEEAENRLHHPVLAALPTMRGLQAEGLPQSYLVNPKSRHADAIRTARTSIVLSKMQVAHKLLLVTSALPGEGKTTFCTNLAFALAQTKRTLLIDLDLRNPQVGLRLGLPEDACGIADLALGAAELKDCVHAVRGSPLLVMPAGEVVEQPEEFLLSPRFRDTLRSLANRVDIVLIDSPPVDDCRDALILAQEANDTVYVVKARGTPHPMALRGLEQLRRAGASILGLVLTNIEVPGGRRLRRSYAGTSASTFEDSAQHGASTVLGA